MSFHFCFQIFLLLFLILNISSYGLIARFRRRDREDYFSVDEDEATVYRISLWLCTVALAVSVGATLLLPISIASNEVLLLYPNSYYVKWLNSSLIQGTIFNTMNNSSGNKFIWEIYKLKLSFIQGSGITCSSFRICRSLYFYHLPTSSQNLRVSSATAR